MTTLLDRTFLGIEFRDDSVVLALLRNSLSGIKLLSSETFPLKEGDDTVNEIRGFISRQGAVISNVFVSVPDRWAITKFIDIPSIKDRNWNAISNMMKFEIERHIPFPIESVAYDFLVLQKKADHFSIVFVAVQNEKVDIVKELLGKLALRPYAITIYSFAVLGAIELSGVPVGGLREVIGITRRSNVLGNKDGTGVSLFVNGTNASISVIREGACIYLRTFEFSTGRAAELLSEAGRKLLITRFDKLLVGGDISSMKDIVAELKEKLAAENVIVGEVTAFSGTVRGQKINGLAAAVGACFSGLGLGTHRINVLPHKSGYEIKKAAPLATKIFLFLIAAVLVGMFAVNAVKQKNYIEGLDAALKENEPAVKALEMITSDIDLLKKQGAVLYDLKRSEITLEVLAELSAVLPSDAWVTNLQYKGSDIKGKNAGGELIISGLASSSSILIPLLEDSVYFEKVEFVGPIKKKDLKEQFKIKAVVLVPPDKEKR